MARDLDLETLRLLTSVHENGSMSAAARELGISQPAATSRLREFEARWQLSVVQRSTRGSTMTTDGLAVVSWARSVLHECDKMRAGLAALNSERANEVGLAASLTIAEFIMPRWLGELHVLAPEIRPKLQVVNSDRVAALVRGGGVDVGFIETAARPAGLAHRVVGTDRLIVVVSPRHPWARYRHAVPADVLLKALWVMREPGSGTRDTFESALGAQPQLALESSSTTALIGAAIAGVGPSVMSARAVTREIETGRLAEVSTELDLRRPLTAIWKRDVRMSAPVAELLKIAERSAGSVVD